MGRRKSGAIFPMHLSVSAFEAEGRRYFTGIIIDLADQGTTDALREQALFQAIFNHLPDAVVVVDAAGQIILCNLAVTRVFGYAPEEMIGQPATNLYAGAAEHSRVRAIEKNLPSNDGTLAPLTIRFRRKSGEEFPSETVLGPARPERRVRRLSSPSCATSASRSCRRRRCASPSAWRRSASSPAASRTTSTIC